MGVRCGKLSRFTGTVRRQKRERAAWGCKRRRDHSPLFSCVGIVVHAQDGLAKEKLGGRFAAAAVWWLPLFARLFSTRRCRPAFVQCFVVRCECLPALRSGFSSGLGALVCVLILVAVEKGGRGRELRIGSIGGRRGKQFQMQGCGCGFLLVEPLW